MDAKKRLWSIVATAALVLGVSAFGASPALASGPATPTVATAAIGSSVVAKAAGQIRPAIWGTVIKVLTSKPACETARNFYNTTFPDLPKVKCLKMGKVWVVVPR